MNGFGPLELGLLALALAMDAFSVAAAAAPAIRRRHGALRMALAFGAFQALMPLLGALAGRPLVELVRAWDHWVACPVIGAVAAVLTLLGARLGLAAGRRFGRAAEAAGGLVLLALGVRMLSFC